MHIHSSIRADRLAWTPADGETLIAACEEVFPDFNGVSTNVMSRTDVLRRLEYGSYRITSAAAQVIGLYPTGGVPEMIAALVVAGRLMLVERRFERPIGGSRGRRRRAPVAPAQPKIESKTATSWIRIQVVHHETEAPFAGVRISIRLPGGQEVRGRTNAAGMASVEDIEPGVCDAWCSLQGARLRRTLAFVGMGKPDGVSPNGDASLGLRSVGGAEWIAHIDEHRVRTGETLQSIAVLHGYSWRELAEFNWDASAPDVINRHLRDDVGCTLMTLDRKNYRFTSEDTPGIIYIPRPWSQSGLATGRTHVIRARIAAGFRLILENERGLRIPEAEYEATLADGSQRNGRLGRNGLALIQDPPPGPVEVRYPDLDDVEAKSLAAATRRALDERQPLEIHRLFRYPSETIRRAFQAYDRYFNDYHGHGLRYDLKHEFFSDPDAELIFFGYLSELDGFSAQPDAGEPAPVHAPEENVHA